MCVYDYSVKCCQMVRAVPVELCFANAFAEICVACVPSCLTAGFDAVRCCSCEEYRNVKKRRDESVLSLSAEAYEAGIFRVGQNLSYETISLSRYSSMIMMLTDCESRITLTSTTHQGDKAPIRHQNKVRDVLRGYCMPNERKDSREKHIKLRLPCRFDRLVRPTVINLVPVWSKVEQNTPASASSDPG